MINLPNGDTIQYKLLEVHDDDTCTFEILVAPDYLTEEDINALISEDFHRKMKDLINEDWA